MDIDTTAAALANLAGGGVTEAEPAEQRQLPDIAAGMLSPFGMLFGSWGGGDSHAGVTVTPQTALTCRAIYSYVTVIANALASLPIHVIDRQDGGKVREHPAAAVLDDPNPYMTPVVWMEAFALNLLLYGNGYNFAERDSFYTPVALYPLKAADTAPRRQDGELVFVSRSGGRTFTLPAESVTHVPNVSFDGIVGLSPIDHARHTIGLSLALDEFASRFFRNGANVQHVVELPNMSKEALANFKAMWTSEYAGVANAHKTAAAPGLKVHRLGAHPQESQAVESRLHQLREVAGIYRVPPHKIGDLERATFSNIEQQDLEFMQSTVQPWAIKIEQELTRKLLREDEKARLQIRFNLDALIRASTKDRYAAHRTAVGGPWMSINEARKLEGLAPIERGDDVLSPLNSAPASERSADESDVTAELLGQVTGQLVRKEINALGRAARKHAGDGAAFRAFLDEFYASHVELVRSALPRTYQRVELVSELGDRARSEAAEAFAAGTFEALLTRWEQRPAEMAEQILDAAMPNSRRRRQ